MTARASQGETRGFFVNLGSCFSGDAGCRARFKWDLNSLFSIARVPILNFASLRNLELVLDKVEWVGIFIPRDAPVILESRVEESEINQEMENARAGTGALARLP